MKKSLLLLIPIAGAVGMSFLYNGSSIEKYHVDGIEAVNFSSNPLPERTGAPGDGNCTQCHIGSVMSAEGVVEFNLAGGPTYTPGDTYPITITSDGGAKNGFELTILDASNNAAGTFTAGDNTSLVTSSERNYVRHSASDGITSWTFDWIAPSTDMGELTAYYAVTKANNNGGTSGDEVFIGNTTVESITASVQENPIDKGYHVYFNENTRTLNLNYVLLNDSKVVLNVQDLSGRLIEYFDFGFQSSGDYSDVLTLSEATPQNVYILSLFIENKVYNRKVILK